MPVVPLGVDAYKRQSSSQPETRLVNLFIEEDKSGASPDEVMRLQRPGLTLTKAFDSPIRALYQSDNTITQDMVLISGTDVLTFDGATATSIATVEDDGLPAKVIATYERLAILSAGVVTIYNGTTATVIKIRDTLKDGDSAEELTDLDPIIDIDTLNGYIIMGTASGRFYWLVPGEVTEQALNYATDEALPDGLRAVRRLRDDLFFFGSQSIEVWQASGDADATFTRAAGRLVDRGLMSRDCLAIFDNSLIWVGENGVVYRMAEVPERLSDFGIEERIAKRTDLPCASVVTVLGHTFYLLTIPGEGSYAYDAATKLWSEWSSPGITGWLGSVAVDTLNGPIAADATGGLYRLDTSVSTDAGKPFQRLVTGTVALPRGQVPVGSLAIGVGTDVPASFFLRWHDPRRGWSQPIELRARGEADIINAWRLGAARAPCRTFELSTISPAIVRISGAIANEGWRV